MKQTAKTHWVWTQKAADTWEQIKAEKYPEQKLESRSAGTPVYEDYRESCPTLWFNKGYVIDASDYCHSADDSEEDKWQMTFPQYCQNYLENCKYRKSYEANAEKWGNKKHDLLPLWEVELRERAKEGAIPSPVLMSYIRQFGEGQMFRTFRGVYEKGISDFKIPLQVRQARKTEKAQPASRA